MMAQKSNPTNILARVVAIALLSVIVAPLKSTLVIGQQCESTRRGLIPGDVTIGFLFPFLDPSPDGFSCATGSGPVSDPERIQLLEAAIYAINDATTTTVPGIKIGLEAWDTCSSGSVSVERSVAYLGDRTPTKQVNPVPCDNAAFKPVIVGHLEAEGRSVASLLTDARVPVVSYAATTADLTTDDQYGYFSRNIASDDDIAQALAGILKRMGWKYVAVLTSDNDGETSAGETFTKVAESNGICVSVSNMIPEGSKVDADYDAALSTIAANTQIKVVVIFMSSGMAQRTYAAQSRQSGLDLQWLTGHRALLDPASLDQQPALTRGLIGVTPQTLVATVPDSFDTYFQNLTPETVDVTADPWFYDYWQQTLGCNIGGAMGSTPQCGSTQAQQHRTNYLRNPYANAVSQAVMAAKLAVQSLHAQKCGATLGVCGALLSSTPEEWLAAVRATTNIGLDGSAANTGLSIVNMKSDATATTGYSLQQIGSWQDGTMTFDPSNADSWTGSVQQPVQSVCGVPCNDLACGAITDNRTMVYLPGDIILGGLYALHAWDDASNICSDLMSEGMLRLEGMLYALDQINADNTILPGITLGVDAFDTCFSPRQAGEAAQHFITNADFGNSGLGQRVSADGSKEFVYGVIGPGSDDEIVMANRVLSLYDIPLIAFDSSSSTLSNSQNYPNVARVTPVSYADTIPLARALAEKGIKYIQTIYTSGFSAANSVLGSISRQNDVCISQGLQVRATFTQADWENTFSRLDARPEAKAVVILTESAVAQTFVTELRNRNLIGRYYLVGNQAFPVDYFLQNDADAIKGLTIVQRKQRTYPSVLQNYLTGLTPNTNTRNPWFAEFWMNQFQCDLDGYTSSFGTQCTGNEALSQAQVADTVLPDVIDATYALARALDAIQKTECTSPGNVCQQMALVSGADLFRGITQQFFSSSLGDGENVRFNSIGDGVTSFYVYNYQMNGGALNAVQIASYISYGFATTTATIKVYDENGQEIDSPTVECTGVCDECSQIDKGKTAYIQGDIYLGGFFGISEPNEDQYTCSGKVNDYNIQLIEAFLFAVDEVNNDPNILPNMKLGAVGFDTCGSAERARRETSNYVGGTVEYRGGYFPTSVSVAGVIGGQTSDTSIAIAEVLNSFQINQISYGASDTDLGDDEKYPYFLRTVPTDTKQATALVDLIANFGWSYVSVVYSDNAYGNDIFEEFRQQVQKKDICIAMAISIPTTGVIDYAQIISQLSSNPQAKVVALLTSDRHTKGVLEGAEMAGVSGLQWIGSDTWGSREYITANASSVAAGALIVELQDLDVWGFKNAFESRTAYNNNRNPWWQDYLMDTFQCQISGRPTRFDQFCSSGQLDFTGKFVPGVEIGYIADAVKAFAMGLDATIKSLCPDMTEYETCDAIHTYPLVVRDHIKNVSFMKPGGTSFQFNERGDGLPRYDIISIGENLQYNKVGSWESDSLQISQAPPVLALPSQCSGRCAECSQATSVQPTPIQRSGELQIAGLFAAREKSDDINAVCGSPNLSGVLAAEAMLYAINTINADQTILPRVTLGTMTFDTCQSAARGVSQLAGYLGGAGAEGENRPWFQLAGILAGGSEAVVTGAALLADQYKYPEIVYSPMTVNSDSPSTLLNVAPVNNNKASALMDLLGNYRWNYVGVLYDPNDPDQTSMLRAFQAVSQMDGICIGATVQLTSSNSAAVLQTLRGKAGLGVVIIFANADLTKMLLEASRTSPSTDRFTFILAFPNKYSTRDVTSSMVGSLAIFSLPPPTDLQQYFASLSATAPGANQWYIDYIENEYGCDADGSGNYPMMCTGMERVSADDVMTFGGVAADVVNSVNVIARGMDQVLKQRCSSTYSGLCPSFLEASANPQDLYDALSDVTFTGIDGKTVQFDDGGKRVPQFDVWNGQQTERNQDFVKVGSWEDGMLTLTAGDVQLLDGSSDPSTVQSSCDRGEACMSTCSTGSPTRSPTTDRPDPDRTNALPFSNLSGIQFYILIIIMGVGVLVTMAMIIMVIARWSNPTMLGISSLLHLTLLLGILMLYVLVPILFSPTSAVVCGLQRAVCGVAFAFCFISVFLLIVRLYRIGIRERRITGKRAPLISNGSQALFFVVLFLVEVVFLIQWFVQQPPTEFTYVEVDDSSDGGSTTTMYCGYASRDMSMSLLYVYLLMVLSLVVSVQAWCSVRVVFSREFAIIILAVTLCICTMVAWIIATVVVDRRYTELAASINAIVQASILLFMLVVPKAKLLCCGHHDEFWESASVTSSEFVTHPRDGGDFSGVENYQNEAEDNNYEVPMQVPIDDPTVHDNAAFDDSLPEKMVTFTDY